MDAFITKLQLVSLVCGFFFGKHGQSTVEFSAEDIIRDHIGANPEDLEPLRDVLATMAALGIIGITDAGKLTVSAIEMNVVQTLNRRALDTVKQMVGA